MFGPTAVRAFQTRELKFKLGGNIRNQKLFRTMKDDVVQYLQAYWFHIRLVFKRSSGTQFLNSDPKVLFPVLRAYFSKLAREREKRQF